MEVNLVLSGGAAKGFAHIGVLMALEELGFKIQSISGVSAGAIVGSYYFAGYSPQEMINLIHKTNWGRLFRPSFPLRSLLSSKQIEQYLRQTLKKSSFEELKGRLYITTLDLKTLSVVTFSSGELIRPLMGSFALPGIFEPIKINEMLLVDGGIVNNLPVEPLMDKKPCICVDVTKLSDSTPATNIFSVLIRSFNAILKHTYYIKKTYCDVLIEPDLSKFSMLGLKDANNIVKIGYETAFKNIKSWLECQQR
ncbi:MAG: patatin-like phospholipase family protein [Aquificaceae bacterium]